MRTGYLVAAVLLFATSGAAFGQSLDGALDATATGSGANANAGVRASVRLERRELRRQERAAQINAIRAARGLEARQKGAVNGLTATSESAARLMAVPEENGDQPQTVEPGEPGTQDPAADGSESPNDIFLTGFVEEELTLEAQILECYEECFDDDGAGEDPAYDGEVRDDSTPDDEYLSIYTLGGPDGIIVRGRDNAEVSGNGSAGLFASLEQLRARADLRSEVNAGVNGGAGTVRENGELAAQLLARRLAQIDRLRDRALAEGNAALLDRADQLEAAVRLRFEAVTNATASSGSDTSASTAGAGETEAAGTATP